MDEILREDERTQGITLVYRILVISLRFIKYCNVPGDKDERGGEQESQHVEKGTNVKATAGAEQLEAAWVPVETGDAGLLGETVHFPWPPAPLPLRCPPCTCGTSYTSQVQSQCSQCTVSGNL